MNDESLELTIPGEVLREEFLIPLKKAQYRLAKEIGFLSGVSNEINLGKRAIMPDTALRFLRYLSGLLDESSIVSRPTES